MSYKILEGKKGIIFGALDEQSIAWKTAESVSDAGGVFVLTNAPVAMRMGTINDLAKKISEDLNEKISLATVYNTVHHFEKKGYLKEIAINSDKSYFDTNTSAHHHFYDEDTHELIDCHQNDIDSINIKNNVTGKKVKSVEVLIKVASDNQNQN